MHGGIKQGAEPQQSAEIGIADNQPLDDIVGKDRNGTGSQRRDVVIEHAHGVSVEIDEITGHVKRHQLSLTVEAVHVPTDKPLDQIDAAIDPVAVTNQLVARIILNNRTDRRFERGGLFHAQFLAVPTHQESFRRHGLVPRCH